MRARRLIRFPHKCSAISNSAAQKRSSVWGLIVWALCTVESPDIAHAYLVQESENPSIVRERDVDTTTVSDNAGGVRMEPAGKFVVPENRTEEVWKFLCSYFGDNSEVLKSLGPGFTCHFSEQLFTDTYFDTPSLQIAAKKSGVRHRRCVDITKSNDVQIGRELMQVNATDLSYSELERSDAVFDIEYLTSIESPDDTHPMLGIIHRAQRTGFQDRLRSVGIDPGSMRPVFSISNLRRQVTIKRNDQPVLFIALDDSSTSALWARCHFYEIQTGIHHALLHQSEEPSLGYLQQVHAETLVALSTRFPSLQRDLEPKYCKALTALERRIPGYRFLIKLGLDNADGMFLSAVATIGMLIGSFLGIQKISNISRQPRIICSAQKLCAR